MSDIGRVINSSPRSSPGSTGTIETAALTRVHSNVVLRVVLVQVIRGTMDVCAQALRKISEQPELMLRGTSSNSLRVTTFLLSSKKTEFYAYIENVPNVIECNCVTGDYAMLLQVEFWNTNELDHFVNELQRFGKTKTQIVFSTSVEHRNLPIRNPEEKAAAFA